MSLAFALEKQVAVSAVLRACSLTTAIFNKLVKDEKLTKDDKSPVTGSFALSYSNDMIDDHLFWIEFFHLLDLALAKT